MTLYKYVSVDEAGNLKKGTLDGSSMQQIHQQLADMKLTVIELTPTHEGIIFFRGWLSHRQSRITSASLSLFTFQLAALLTAGVPIAQALKNIADQLNNRYFRHVISTVRTRVQEGHSIASGMHEFPKVFPELYRETIACGEKSGKLDEVVNKLARYLEQQANTRQKIQQALIYPTLLLLVSGIIIFYLLTYSIPAITRTFTESGHALPVVTVFLLQLCNGLKSYGMTTLLVLAALYFSLIYFYRDKVFRMRFQLLLAKIPFFNRAASLINSARFARTLGILFAAGIPIVEAMKTACNIITWLPMKEAVTEAIVDVSKGRSIHQALLLTGYFTPITLQLIASGESVGKLDVMLDKAADYQEQQVSRWITSALSLFEPLVILFMGLIVLFIVMAALLPIFQMNDFLAV